MTIKKLVRLLRKNQPQTIKEIRRLGIRATFLDAGCFRKTYIVRDLPLVLKVSMDNGRHTKNEIAALRKIQTWVRYRALRRYMPKVYYCNSNGSVLLMRQYERFRRSRLRVEILDVLSNIVKDSFSLRYGPDIHCSNAGLDSKGRIKFIDLGLFHL